VERKLVTIVFADLVGSTALADEQDPERTRALLSRFYDRMAAEVDAAGGTVEKFAGDAVMAAFGAPTAHEDDAERALHAALAMQRRLGEIDERLSLRIGVNTGEVVVDRPREGSSFVTGDAVNVAARLEQAAEPGEILVGERTVAAVGGAFEFDEPTAVEAKGKPGGLTARRLVRSLSLMRPRGVSGLRPVFVGRDAQLEQLLDAYRATVEAAAPRLVTVLGDAGVGKTRLVRELSRALEGETPQPLRRTGRCLSYGDATTYWPLGEVLREHFGILENDDRETILEHLGGWEMLGITLNLDVAGDLHPLAVRDRFQDAWVDFLTGLAAELPLVLLIEDAHWAEDQLLDLLEQLLRDVRGPVLLIVTARPELTDRRPGWRARSTELIELDRLTAETAVRMVDELLAAPVPERVRGMIVERAEGNPFFVEELLGMLIDRGLLERQNGSWALRELPDEVAVPDSVQAVLAARIDFLPQAEKAALQAAAVIGRIFWAGPVYELVEGEPNLRMLEERGFIFRRPSSTLAGDREYAIKHALTREVAYASLPKARRARLHASFADWIARVGRDEHAPLLAHHYAEAVRPEDVDFAWAGEDDELERVRGEALDWLRRAGTLAISRYEIDEGIELLERALELGPGPPDRSELWREIGRAHALKFEGEAFWTAMERSLEVSVDRAIRADSYAELAFQTAIRSGMWTVLPDSSLVESWIEQALELAGEEEGASRVKALLARAFWNPSQAEVAEQAGALAERLGDPELVSRAWQARTEAAFVNGNYDAALRAAGKALEIPAELTDPDHIADVYEHAIPPCVATGRLDEARRLSARHIEAVQPLSVHHRLHGFAVRLEIEEAAGGWDAVLDLAPSTEAAVDANLATPCVRNSRSLLITALAAAYRGDEAASRRYEERGEELSGGADIVLSAPRTRLAIARGRLDEVERVVPTPDGLERAHSWYGLQSAAARLDALAVLGRKQELEAEARRLGRPGTYLEPFALRALALVREDEALLEEAVAKFEALGLSWHAEQARLELQA
jgi:class 3 adenylate cyclase/tetratricopeptide (TPR) repeat protein